MQPHGRILSAGIAWTMIPRNSNLEPDPPEFPPQSRVPRWVMLLGMVTMFAVLGMGYISLRVVQRMRQFKQLAVEIKTDYRQLDAEFPFNAPLLPTPPSADRLHAYYRARSGFAAHVAPPMEARAETILASGEAAKMSDVARLFGPFYDLLKKGTQSHLAILRDEQMGPSEFFWIHGYVLNTVLDAPTEDPRRAHLEWVLHSLEQGSAPLSTDTRRFAAGEFRRELDRRYAAFPDMKPVDVNEYEIEGEAMSCLDIIAATPRLHDGLGIRPLPPGTEPSPRDGALNLLKEKRHADQAIRDFGTG